VSKSPAERTADSPERSAQPDLAALMFFNEMQIEKKKVNKKKTVNQSPLHDILFGILKRQSNYFKAINVLARIMQLKRRHTNMKELQRLAERQFFAAFQQEGVEYIQNFRGNGFYTLKKEDILIVKGRDTFNGTTEFNLVPPHTMLYTRLAETFHQKYHSFASPVYIRTQLLDAGYYLPQVTKRLKSLQDGCALCRKRIQKKLHTVMGTVAENRLTYNQPFKGMQADLIGPLQVREFVNARGSRKVWLLSGICHFSRYISLTLVESLSKESILNAFKIHALRYGESQQIETDFGTNFSSAKNILQEGDVISEEDVKWITETLKSSGVHLVQRVPKAPWIQGSIERANSVIKKIMPGKKMTVFQLALLIENIIFHVNRRPIGCSTTLESIRPADIIPVWSKLNPRAEMAGCAKIIESARTEFFEKWNELYKLSILKQNKWLSTNHTLAEGDIVLILDLKNDHGYPKIGRITKIEKDSSEVQRYFSVEYKQKKKTFLTVRRPAQSLCMVMGETEEKLVDSLSFIEEEDLPDIQKNKKATRVQFVGSSDEIKDQ
jgi:hypothetical protein